MLMRCEEMMAGRLPSRVISSPFVVARRVDEGKKAEVGNSTQLRSRPASALLKKKYRKREQKKTRAARH